MKKLYFGILSLILAFNLNSQTIFDFETPETSTHFQYFGSSLEGTLNSIIANPNPTGVNTSDSVAVYTKPANSETWAGAYANPAPAMPIDAANGGQVCIDVHMDHAGNLALKLEQSQDGGADWITTVENTVIGEWVTLCYDLSNDAIEGDISPADGYSYNQMVLFFDFGSNDVVDVTSYFDNIVYEADPEDNDTIFDFETPETSTHFQYFGSSLEGTLNSIIANPNPTGVNTSDSVAVYTKPANSETWAGAFANPAPAMPIDATNGGQVCIDVHMDHAGNLALKLEQSQDGGADWITTVENTVTGEWVTLCYDLSNDAIEGDISPADGYSYNQMVLFFDFGSNDVVDVTSYFDNIVYEADEVGETTTIVDIVVNSEVHTILETAVLAAGLETTLSGPGPFTLFAPSDDAFANLPEGLLDVVLADPDGLLTDILLYHALDSDVRSTDLMDGMVVATINGKDVTVTINEDGVFINDAKVTMADIEADNGVVHVIDAVLIPPADPDTDGVIVDFEAPETSTHFQYFGSSLEPMLTGIIANPNPTGVNTSDSVGVYVKAANSQVWAGAFSNPNPTVEIDATAGGEVCVDVHMDHIGNLALKLENGDGALNWITVVENTVVNEWETLCYDLDAIAIEDPMITATGNVYKTVVLFFDFQANDAVDVTSYFDNIVYKEPTSSIEGKTIPVQEFTLTPNATNLYTTLKWSDLSDKIISIIDSNGRLLESMRASKYETEKVINVINFPAGVYFVKVDSANKSGIQKLVVGK